MEQHLQKKRERRRQPDDEDSEKGVWENVFSIN